MIQGFQLYVNSYVIFHYIDLGHCRGDLEIILLCNFTILSILSGSILYLDLRIIIASQVDCLSWTWMEPNFFWIMLTIRSISCSTPIKSTEQLINRLTVNQLLIQSTDQSINQSIYR